jgi:hypothetical protein
MAPDLEPGTPQAAAVAWVEAVMDRGDLSQAWPLTDPTLRLVLAQDWVWNHRHDPAIGHGRDWDTIARGLAQYPPQHQLWDRFAGEVVGLWQRIWKGFSASRWRVWEQPEVLGLDLEMVTFVEPNPASEAGDLGSQPGRGSLARRFAMRHTDDGWRVAGVNGDQLFEPGWPPALGQQAGQI